MRLAGRINDATRSEKPAPVSPAVPNANGSLREPVPPSLACGVVSAGVVAMLHKEQGEFVAPNNPDVLTLVKLDRLLAGFSIMSPRAESLGLGDRVSIAFAAGNRKAEGVVEFIAPIIDAESGTVQVRVRLENPDGRFRSGERCTLLLPK